MTATLIEQSQPVRVQIVEDEAIVAYDLRQSLEALGYSVCGIASSENQAIELAQRDRPDLVLMDINLGRGGDGTVAARDISLRLSLPVIYLTAYAGEDILQKAIEAAPYGYVLKPIQIGELHATMCAALARIAEEKKTRRAERRFRLALQAAQLGVMEVEGNRQRLQIEGYLAQRLLPNAESFTLSRTEFLERVEDVEVRHRLDSMISRGELVEMRLAWRTGSGERIWLELYASYFPEEDRLVGVLSDVSDRVIAEERLRQAAVVFETAGDGILVLDREQRVRSVNKSFERITGWSGTEVHGQLPKAFLYASRTKDRQREELAPLGEHVEVTCRRRDGSVFPAWQRLAAVQNESGDVIHHVLTLCDISALRGAENRLTHIALHDALTGLGNRHQFEICLRHAITRAASAADRGRFALLFMDLDGFKHINDSLGHSVGDELLVELAHRVQGVLRQDDVATRMGGDEFLILLAGASAEEDVAAISRKLLAIVSEPVQTSVGQAVNVTASIGIALFPEHADSADDLIRAADTAMYEAKARGRNRYTVFSRGLAHRALERLQLEQGLRHAVEREELELNWQPIVDMQSGRILGAEALLRWTHPVSGRISPERFIPLAEETGLILPLGSWVLEQACRHAAQWRAKGLDPGRIAVNVSAIQLQQSDFADQVAGVLANFGLPPQILELELTESSLQRGEAVQMALHRLRALGVHLALDDFGTGFSSLSMLKFLPLNRLKIDRSFVRDIAVDPNDMAIARTVAVMAATMGLAVTAEGVESEIQRNILLGLNVREAQGWLYHPALAADAFAALMVDN